MEYNFEDLQVEAVDSNTIRVCYGDRGSYTFDLIYPSDINSDFELNPYWRNNTFIINCTTKDDLQVLNMTVNGENAKIRTSRRDFIGWFGRNQLYVELFNTYVITEWSIDVRVGSDFAQTFIPLPPPVDDGWLKIDFKCMQTDENFRKPCKFSFWYYQLHEYMRNKTYCGIFLSNHQLNNKQINGKFHLVLDYNRQDFDIKIKEDMIIEFERLSFIQKYFSIICIV